MTLREERTRAAVWASGLLIKIARDTRPPLELRKRAIPQSASPLAGPSLAG